jgi:D-tyrosyl-tRNA(Tyr) deacylase
VISLIQRVRQARVEINRAVSGQIGQGLLVLVGFEPGDDRAEVERQLERMLNYRVFADDQDKMNLSLRDIGGGLLLVPQFTLAADTARGRRPSFTSAAPPPLGSELFDGLLQLARERHSPIASGVFGADMQVHLQNDGPVTFILR